MTLKIRADVAREARDIIAQWPLNSFIAVNPLGAHEDARFESIQIPGVALTRPVAAYRVDVESGRITPADLMAAVLERIPELRYDHEHTDPTVLSAVDLVVAELTDPAVSTNSSVAPARSYGRVDELVAKWVAAFLDPHPLWPMPHRSEGLYSAWRTLTVHDPDLPRSARRIARMLPTRPDDAIAYALAQLQGATQGATQDVSPALRDELAGLPGWTAHIKWRSEHVGDIDLVEYVAVRLSLRLLLGLPAIAPPQPPSNDVDGLWERATRLVDRLGGSSERITVAVAARALALHPVHDHPFTFQRAYELHYARPLLHSLNTSHPGAGTRPTTQLVACIDSRSEGIRRHVEQLDPGMETFGFAGFFGVPIRFTTYDSPSSIDSLPALLAPHHHVTERAQHPRLAGGRINHLRTQQALAAGIHAGESTTASPFAFAETTGWLFGAATALRTLAPTIAARLAAALTSAPRLETSVTVADAFTLEERAGLAEASLRMMGLSRFAPLVILAGHGSTSTNNLYESALDCGACGGNRGKANARSAAAIFNDPDVRALLSERGLPIPADTFFIAAEHDTVTDHIATLDVHLVPATHLTLVDDFRRLQQTASDALVRERSRSLPGASPRHRPQKTRRRADDWAEVYPEWGLAGNAAFLIGPRDLTRALDLERRVFLHSYQPELDSNGAALETILTAPVVVAQWINHQYYFSALNPDSLGAGTKTIHNAIGTIGVLSGQGGDIRRGLPWQSVGIGDRLVHEPVRLTVIVQAPLDRITTIIGRNAVLRSLFDNSWIFLTAREDAASPWHSYGQYGWFEPSLALHTSEGETS